jgi:hypothetical protein
MVERVATLVVSFHNEATTSFPHQKEFQKQIMNSFNPQIAVVFSVSS